MYINGIAGYLSRFEGTEVDAAVERTQTLDAEFAEKVDKTTEVNGHALTGDITITAEDTGALPDTTPYGASLSWNNGILSLLGPTGIPISSQYITSEAQWGHIAGILSDQEDLVAALAEKYDASNPDGFITGITSTDVTTALGYTPYNGSTNPNGYITGISGTDVTTALGYTPYNAANPAGYITGINSADVTTALGYTPYNATNPAGYITGINSADVTTALGYTPYNATNPAGYISSASLSTLTDTSLSSVTGGQFLEYDGTSSKWKNKSLASTDVTTALGFTPYNATNPDGYITGIDSTDVTTALGFTPYDATNPDGFISGIDSTDVTTALGFTPYDATNPDGFISGIDSTDVTTALGFTPYDATNPDGFISSASLSTLTDTSLSSVTGGQFLEYNSTSSKWENKSLASTDVTTALGYTPYNSTNPSGYITGISSSDVTTALGFTPYDATNPSGYISGITSGDVTTALGYTPYNATNPSGYISSASLSTLTDTSLSSITGGQFLEYDSTSSKWKNKSLASTDVTTALGYTPYDSTNPSGYITSASLPTIDQTYSGTSTNAQSGVAIQGELTTNYQAKITSSAMLSSDLVDDTNKTHKFATAAQLSQITTNQNNINTINGKIPAEATSTNQLADKAFVNSSIASNTANFIGTFSSVAELEAYTGTVTNNDYAFVTNSVVTNNGSDWTTFSALDAYNKSLLTNLDYAWVVNGTKFDLYRFDIVEQQWDLRVSNTDKADVTLNNAYNRYKASVSGSTVTWAYEYTLNNSSFTSTQWAAINSGINDTLVAQITTNQTDIAGLDSIISGYGDIVTHDVSEFATSAQGGLADTALQPNDNITELVNNAGYITGIDDSDVITALGYTPYNATNPNGYISSASLSTLTDTSLSSITGGQFLEYDSTSSKWKNKSLASTDVTTALGYTPYDSTNPSGYITGISSSDVTTALGYTPYNSTNPSGYISSASLSTLTDTSLSSITGGQFLEYDSTSSKWKNKSLDSTDVTTALGYTPYNATNPDGYITGIDSTDVTTALGYTPYDSTNPSGYITGISSTDVTTALGYTPYDSTNPSGYITGISSSDVTTALGYTPYNSTNPNGYISSASLSTLTDTSLSSVTGGQFLEYDSTSSKWKNKSLASTDVTTALGYTPYDSTNPSGYITGISSSDVTTALGYTPYDSTNPSGYITGITSGDVTTALGYTPYDSTNPSGYITGITSSDVTTALGYTPYSSANPSGYISSASMSSLTDTSLSSLSGGQFLKYDSTAAKWKNVSLAGTDVTTALGYTPYDSTNPSGYISSASLSTLTDTSLSSITGGQFLEYNSTSSKWENKSLASTDVTTALGYTPYDATNPDGYITGIDSTDVTTALGYTPYDSTNPDGYITGIDDDDVINALGYTPYSSANPSGYISSAAMSTLTDVALDSVSGGQILVYDGTASKWKNQNAPATAVWGNITGTLSNQTDLQTALNGKQATITGAASTVVSNNLTTGRVVISNSSGKIAVSSITDTKLGYLTDVTSNIQVQLNGKQDTISGLDTIISGAAAGATALQPNDNITQLTNNAGYITSASLDSLTDTSLSSVTGGQFLEYNSTSSKWENKSLASTDVTTALGYTPYNSTNPSGYISSAALSTLTDVSLSNVTNGQHLVYNSTSGKWENETSTQVTAWGDITGTLSSQTDLQNALNAKQSTITGAASTIASDNLTIGRVLVSNDSGKVAVSSISTTKLGYLTDVTSNIQAQLNNKISSLDLNGLTDVTISSVAGGQFLKYNSTSSKWENKALASSDVTTALGYTPYNSTNPNSYITLGSLSIESDSTDYLTYDNSSGEFGIDVGEIRKLIDIDPDSEDYLGYNSSSGYIFAEVDTTVTDSSTNLVTSGAVASALSGYLTSASLSTLTDVTLTSPTEGQSLTYDATNSKWINTDTTVEWGGISGTLSDQTDLKNALDAKQDLLTSDNAGTNISIVNTPSEATVSGTTQVTLTEAAADGLNYLKLFGDTEQRNLPVEYTEYDGLIGDGLAYIDLNCSLTQDDEIELEFTKTSNVTSKDVFGSRSSASSNNISVILASSGNVVEDFNNSNYTDYRLNTAVSLNTRYKVVMNKTGRYLYQGDTLVASNTTANSDTITTVGCYLFNLAGTGLGSKFQGIIHRCLIKGKRDVVPCGNGTAYGMYDKLNGVFYPNANTEGSFTVGNATVPSPDNPIDIVCNNGAIKIKDDELPIGYKRLKDITFDGEVYYITNTYLTGADTTTFTINATGNGRNVLGCYTGSGSGNNISFYLSTGEFGNYVRYKDNLYRPIINNSGIGQDYTLSITPTGTTGFDTNVTWTELAFTCPNKFYIGWLANASSPKFLGTFKGNVIVNNRAKFIPCERVSDSAIGYYDTYSETFFENQGTGTPTTSGYDNTHNIIYTDGTVETVEIDTTGDTATAEMLLKVGDYQDVQEVIAGSVTRNVGIKVFDGTENWQNISGYYNISKTYIGSDSIVLPAASTDIICTHYETISGVPNRTSINVGGSYVNFRDDNISTLAGFKQYLTDQYNAGTPVIIVYPTSSPTTETVTAQPLTTQEGTNVVEITQASINNLELEVNYNTLSSGVSINFVNDSGYITSAALSTLTDVTLTDPTQGQNLTYDAINQVWINSSSSATVGWGGITGTLSDQTDLKNALDAKQDTLVSGTSIKTINNESILGSGNISISGGASIDDTTPSATKVYSSQKTQALIDALTNRIIALENNINGGNA